MTIDDCFWSSSPRPREINRANRQSSIVNIQFAALAAPAHFRNQLIMYSWVRIQFDGRELVPCHSFSNRSSTAGTPRILSAE